MQAIFESFVVFLLNAICDFLMAEPIIYIVCMILLCWVAKLLMNLCGRRV